MLAAVETTITLRCHSCSHAVSESATPLQIVGVFHPTAIKNVPLPEGARRHRCRSCGWLNVFVPPSRRPVVEVK